MRQQIKLGNHAGPQAPEARIVDLPDVLPEAQKFQGSIDGSSVQLLWWPTLGHLAEVDAKTGVERNLRLRSRQLLSFEGEVELRATLELSSNHGVVGATLGLTPYVPGQNSRQAAQAARSLVVRSQITGKVLEVLVKQGETVQAGQALLIIEAMKMENRVFATTAGTIEQISVRNGDNVATGKELMRLS